MADLSTGNATQEAELLPENACAKCGIRPKAKGHTWCNACKAEAQREYKDREAAHQTTHGFALGAAVMRAKLLTDLASRHPGGLVMVAEVAHWIRNAPAPEPQTAVDTSALSG